MSRDWCGVVHFDSYPHITVWNAPDQDTGVKAARRSASLGAGRVVLVNQIRTLQEGDQTPEGFVLDLADGDA